MLRTDRQGNVARGPACCQGCTDFQCLETLTTEDDVKAWAADAPIFFERHSLLKPGCPRHGSQLIANGKCGVLCRGSGKYRCKYPCNADVRTTLPWWSGHNEAPLAAYVYGAWAIVTGSKPTWRNSLGFVGMDFWAWLLPREPALIIDPHQAHGKQLQRMFCNALVKVKQNTLNRWLGEDARATLAQPQAAAARDEEPTFSQAMAQVAELRDEVAKLRSERDTALALVTAMRAFMNWGAPPADRPRQGPGPHLPDVDPA